MRNVLKFHLYVPVAELATRQTARTCIVSSILSFTNYSKRLTTFFDFSRSIGLAYDAERAQHMLVSLAQKDLPSIALANSIYLMENHLSGGATLASSEEAFLDETLVSFEKAISETSTAQVSRSIVPCSVF